MDRLQRVFVALVVLLVLTAGIGVTAQQVNTQYAVNSGIVTLDGSNPTSATHGLSSVDACVVQLMTPNNSASNFGPTTGGEPITLTFEAHATRGQLDIYAWVNADPPTASTATTYRVAWFCIGDI